MRIRVKSASDATAAEIKYHLQCWVRSVYLFPFLLVLARARNGF